VDIWLMNKIKLDEHARLPPATPIQQLLSVSPAIFHAGSVSRGDFAYRLFYCSDHSIGKRKFQVLMSTESDLSTVDRVLETFDFAFCRVALQRDRLVIQDVRAVVERSDPAPSYAGQLRNSVSTEHDRLRNAYRAQKYIRRGFSVPPLTEDGDFGMPTFKVAGCTSTLLPSPSHMLHHSREICIWTTCTCDGCHNWHLSDV
jgi:hypothetical protein